MALKLGVKMRPIKVHKIRFIKGERELQRILLSCVISPTSESKLDPNKLTEIPVQRGENGCINYSSPVNLPDILNIKINI